MDNGLATTSKTLRRVASLVASYINQNYTVSERKVIFSEIDEVLGLKAEQYHICDVELTCDQVQKILSSVNEKEGNRKNNGVYYTPHDLVKFITINLAKLSCGKLKPNNLHVLDLNGIAYKLFCYGKTIFDPTCGAGEFLLVALDIKLDLLELHHENVTVGKIVKVIDTIYGNDINVDSIAITKIRLLLTILHRFGVNKTRGLGARLNRNFTTIDYVESSGNSHLFDIIVGNPPYIEDSKSDSKPIVRYGNVYANVLENSANQLKDSGVLGYVIPLSFISTPRMRKIRELLDRKLNEQFILSYSDRPDSLFTSVHQKLNVFIARKSERKIRYTSNYQYWYRDERENLFDEMVAFQNDFTMKDFIPKLGNRNDYSIFGKVYSIENTIADSFNKGGKSIFLNMRATFWIKAFLEDHTSAEYKTLKFDEDLAYLMMCIFNSSLFWWYWICISDCWHITGKELNTFRVPVKFNRVKARKLASQLEERLEESKVYVGTKQTAYVYKHKKCIDTIHDIDDFVSELYGLSEEENLYIKNFNLRYRLGEGARK